MGRRRTFHHRGICKICGVSPCESKGRNKFGDKLWKNICTVCSDRPYNKFKKNFCEFCGFVPIHKGQLDVDHIDGNHENNSPKNLMTLCANCHRLKSITNGDYEKEILKESVSQPSLFGNSVDVEN